MAKNIFISAGDISGDFHAANLSKSIKKIDPKIIITSLGGRNLEQVSDNFLQDICCLSAFGFTAPFKHYFFLRKVFNKIKNIWKNNKPDKVILVDFYGFNIHIAEYACRNKIPAYYYISPQVWASRRSRINKLAKYVKKMLVILPFEEEVYKETGLDTVFVGHPLIDIIDQNLISKQSNKETIIGFFPGSRKSVIERHLPILEKTAKIIKSKINAKFKIFLNNSPQNVIKSDFQIVNSDNYLERAKLTFAITTSGTVSLENALLGIPMVVFYKVSWFNYWVAKLLVKVKYITMANILLGGELIPEFIQSRADPQIISEKVISMINDSEMMSKTKNELLGLRKILGNPGVSDRAAKIILEE
ncbi:MAG: lipid-A-disaccharide synthase [Elusimicrobia bacterium]|nr:lipid-A-disaccharide synthase [Elusimicrobiota bacterium]